ncbi:ABC transporter ATP-binding protein [Streptomyces marispadix]|uniref:ABC transporter ATP-binding protein/permease n=1 Tax=Streptomyces marispadix TaxID=2922868 RepID=A0ABS9T5U9_9ACTN|nr:ABC transporter ATP-binding protein [Streptomyces marispadix]MCH6163921.1 ABC transporter ATP-binding protein/permease [Streptomyces marispadix]
MTAPTGTSADASADAASAPADASAGTPAGASADDVVFGVAPPHYDPAASENATTLPVGGPATVRGYVRELLRRHRRAFATLVLVNAIAVVASMAGPYLLGGLVEDLTSGSRDLRLGRIVGFFVLALAVQSVFVREVRLRGAMLGERMLADLREDFLVRSVALPPGVLERAGTGDLLSRITTDIDRLANAMREAVPQLSVGVVWTALLLGGLTVTAPPLALAVLVALPVLLVGCRWYYRRAPSAYRSEAAGYAAVAGALAETVDAGRTVEAHRLGARRIALSERRISQWTAWERYTLWLRSVLFPVVNVTNLLLVAGVLMLGGTFVLWGWIGVGQLTTGALLVQMLFEPVGLILRWYDELQVAEVSLGRLVGVREIEPDSGDEMLTPQGRELRANDVRFGYRTGSDVLHGVTMRVPPGTRVALVGPSGAGKSTLGRLLAGIYGPRTGDVALGGAELSRMPAERVRRHVALVNQEHHVFVGSLRDNLLLARTDASDTELWEALRAVDADDWARSLPDGLDSEVGSGGISVAPAHAQQIALARLVLADPHTLVLDEATSLLDPRAARHLERSLAQVLQGRTVVAIAHRLHTAHDADVIAVVEDGRISELGSHDALVEADGAYAALWRSWHG